jgi:GntR family transcriptional regulator
VTALTKSRYQNLAIHARRRTPAVRRTRELLRTMIVQRLLPGDMLPSEWELMSRFGVSRGVVRDALDLLRGEGLIDRLQGAGTFVVAPERQIIQIEQLGAMVRNIDDGDARVRWDLLVHETVPAPRLAAERLEVPEGTPLVYAERRQSLDGEPVMLRSSWLPCDLGEILATDPAAARSSLDDLVEKALGHPVEHADLRIEATLVDDATSSTLALEAGQPLILLERLMYDVHGRPVEYGHARVRADRFALTTHMRRRDVGDAHPAWRERNALAVTPSRSRRVAARLRDVAQG